MSYQSRKQIILKILDEKGDVDVKELAQVLETSEITVRRDLGTMAADGLLYRTHGGAMKLSLVNQPISFVQKSAVNADKKDHICRIAAAQIQDGDVIFMDCGSTVFRMCGFIRDKRIKVITNSLPVVHELLNSAVSINLIGGEVDAERQAVHGSMSIEHIRRYQADKAFLGVGGISVEKGLSAVSEKEAEMTLSMAANAQVTYLLCDSSKLGKDKYLTFAPLTLVNVLITDEQSSEIIQAFTNVGVKVLR
ncbi:DeoR family fructose operon transcriptional repressor [Runella defluvii]|uniref:DeoR family fructose operon transcriptional repressor n=1 Tax=Runella defluvii TaxID=370973 RepID=A0A7W5ZQA6_9BACT|nr:DeoR/GlpR family DNA-binding transcription regulator [Runella defluvii]MBB3840790.1 DeoR family fructose operon transcriptional repressor [Runella defluvii]